MTYPPEVERDGNCCYTYLKAEEFVKAADLFTYSRKIRRVSRVPTIKNEDAAVGTELSWYDIHFHQPWDNEYRILGEDTFEGHYCLVVEAKSKLYSDFYLSKWLIWVEKNSHKPIVIGNKGERLKEVGREAREDMQKAFGQKVFLHLWVKVKEGWADDERALQSLGYGED